MSGQPFAYSTANTTSTDAKGEFIIRLSGSLDSLLPNLKEADQHISADPAKLAG
jgi:hypothetical protein